MSNWKVCSFDWKWVTGQASRVRIFMWFKSVIFVFNYISVGWKSSFANEQLRENTECTTFFLASKQFSRNLSVHFLKYLSSYTLSCIPNFQHQDNVFHHYRLQFTIIISMVCGGKYLNWCQFYFLIDSIMTITTVIR